ncbi:MAG: hypothetical protein FWE65_00640, partial [Eggerthellaceae bacterium]|nr:hypothetical protein [Eggerthellaceae bacterium]
MNTVNLKHGQRLVFIDTPVGSTYTVSEIDPTGYVPSYAITNDNKEIAKDKGVLGETISTGKQIVGEKTSLAAFTNTRDIITPTGITLNELPFVGMVVLALGVFVAFVVLKSRKNRKLED